MLSWLVDIGGGIGQVFHLGVFFAALCGVVIGVVIGVIPGLGPAIAIALAIPLTYEMGPLVAIALMLGIYKGGTYGGSIAAILINTPGTPAAAATVLDGYPLAREGKLGKALNVALAASVVGDIISILILCVIAQPMAAIALKFGPIELFALIVFAMTIIAGLSGQSLLKGLIAALVGIVISTVGIDPLIGMPRFTFDLIVLDDGIPIIPMVIGLFAVTEVLRQAEKAMHHTGGSLLPPASCPDDARMTRREFRQCLPVMAQSSLVGTGIGSLPGTGAATAAYLAYGLARSRSKSPEKYGKGSIEGLAAAEAGNNAVVGGALIPMLTLGVPGDVVTAILMGAMSLHGIHVGPLIFEQYRVFVFSIFGMLLVSVVMMFFVGKAAILSCRQLASLPPAIVMPIVMLLCVIGAYSTNYAMSDVWMMLLFGIFGYVLMKLDIPLPPLIIAFVLAPQLEQSLRQALLLSRGSYAVFVTSPISLGFLLLATFFVIQVVRRSWKQAQSGNRQGQPSA